MIETGLYFGSFNPIHHAHLMLAQWMLNFAALDEVWFVVSPQNPFKSRADLAPAEHRLRMVQLATKNQPLLKACDIELSLPVPSYTINTIDELRRRHADRRFSIIMGGDNLAGLPKWKSADRLMSECRILVYPRPGFDATTTNNNITICNTPQMDISSTMLRQWLAQGKSIENYVPHNVAEYIRQNDIYKP